jgi:hypothetical protein
VERRRDRLIAVLKGHEIVFEHRQGRDVVRCKTLRCTIEKWISIWFNQLAGSGLWTGTSVG